MACSFPAAIARAACAQYLESDVLQKLVAQFFAAGLPVAAICHGVLLAARSRTADGSRSVLFGRRTTALTWALERAGWQVGRIVRFWDPNYYRTYVDAARRARRLHVGAAGSHARAGAP